MWVAVEDADKSWEYLHAGLLWYGIPGETEMRPYHAKTVRAWQAAGRGRWQEACDSCSIKADQFSRFGFLPNHIYLED